ncbi:MAG TPA: multicopper oxidase domain-containing protein, partial [Anaeromyxobacteraceae bacterium]|nr:multicopper oxidase domain-containing protein [Anaeromyxobacteraceae bacterium]
MTKELRAAFGIGAMLLALAAGRAEAAAMTFDLWAKPGSLTLPGAAAPVPVWGYSGTAAGAAAVPGPVLVVNEGDVVTVNLHNLLTEPTALLFKGIDMVPDLAGAAASDGTLETLKTYTFTAGAPGAFLYEAGLLANAQHQVAMGLYGALVVRPAAFPTQAYGDVATAFDDEAVLVLSEIDPALNANPAGFDMRNYAPKFWLINGKAYPGTAGITSGAGRRVLLRYLNAGNWHHSMALLGMRQTIVGLDGSPLLHSRSAVAETLGPGQTMDAIATVPASAAVGNQFALYDASLLLHNNRAPGLGGMLTFVTAAAGTPGGGAAPTTTGVAVAPSPTNGSVAVTLSAAIAASGGRSEER